jgi:hypothetical protein
MSPVITSPLRRCLVASLWLVASSLSAATINVSTSTELQDAIASVSEGDIILLSPGTYLSPSGGFEINEAGKSFTIRAQLRGSAILSGASVRPVLRYVNAAQRNYSVVFENLVFRDGFSNTDGTGAGVTVSDARATFIGCDFLDNTAEASVTGGGGLFLRDDTVAFVIDSTFDGNTSTQEGGGLRVGSGIKAWVHQTSFTNNRTDVPGHRSTSAGGAIHLTNADLWVTNSHFEGNRAGCVGAGIFSLGTFQDPVSVPVANLWVSASTFIDNSVGEANGIVCPFETEGGGIHGENQVHIRIFNSQFYENHAESGGGISNYRAKLEIYDSEFRGNTALGNDSGFGGAVMANSNDANDSSTGNGVFNRPSAELTIERSFFQGRYGNTTFSALKGGCVFTLGDTYRQYGLGGVAKMGSLSENRAIVSISDSVFYDCDVEEVATGSGTGGGFDMVLVDLDLQSSLFVGNDADAAGGGRVSFESLAFVFDNVFAMNTGVKQPAGFSAMGSQVDVNANVFVDNDIQATKGSAIWAYPADGTFTGHFGTPLEVTGFVRNNMFSGNSGIPIWDWDFAAGPANRIVYDNNDFFGSNGLAYKNSLLSDMNASDLNSAVVVRDGGVGNTDKSPANDNLQLGSEPLLAFAMAAPDSIHPGRNSVYAWAHNGTSATRNGQSLAGSAGTLNSPNGSYTLNVDSQEISTEIIGIQATPQATLSATPQEISAGQASTLSWTSPGAVPLSAAINRAVNSSVGASGSTQVMPLGSTEYSFLSFAKEGGAWDTAWVAVDEPLPGTFIEDGFESGDFVAWN